VRPSHDDSLAWFSANRCRIMQNADFTFALRNYLYRRISVGLQPQKLDLQNNQIALAKMPKRKADSLGGVTPVKDSKKAKQDAPAKSNGFARGNMLVDSDSDSGSDEEMGGALLEEPAFKINEEYARRFEHNKKREELQQCLSPKILSYPKLLTSPQ